MLFKALVLSAFAACVAAQTAAATVNSTVLTFESVPMVITDGKATTLTWSTNDTSSPVTILLREGLATNLQTVQVLTTSATGTSFVWTPCTALPNGSDYALEIQQAGQTNYFGPFTIQGASATGTCTGLLSTSSSSSSATSTTSSSSASKTTGTGSMTTTTGTSTSTSTKSTSTSATTTGSGTFQTPTGNAAPASFAYGGSAFALALGGIAAVVIA